VGMRSSTSRVRSPERLEFVARMVWFQPTLAQSIVKAGHWVTGEAPPLPPPLPPLPPPDAKPPPEPPPALAEQSCPVAGSQAKTFPAGSICRHAAQHSSDADQSARFMEH